MDEVIIKNMKKKREKHGFFKNPLAIFTSV